MRNSLLLLFSLFTSLNMLGQGFTADLSKLEISAPLSFGVDSVIDARVNTEILGYIYNKKGKQYSTVFPSVSVDKAFQQAFSSSQNSAKEELMLRINRLFIFQTSNGTDRFFTGEINLSFISASEQSYSELFRASQSVSFKAKYGNKHVVYVVQELIDSCLIDFEKRMKHDKLRPAQVSQDKLLLAPSTNDVRILKKAPNKKGLYYSYYDLRDNIIDTSTTFTLDLKKAKDAEAQKAKIDFEDKSISKYDVYALSDGQNIHLRTGNHFTQVTDTANAWWLDEYSDFEVANGYGAGMLASAIVGGLVGAAIFASVADAPTDYSKYIVDFDRGAVVPFPYPNPEKIKGEILFYGSSFLNEGDTMALSINGAPPVKLSRDHYYIYESDYKSEPIEACISFKSNKHCETYSTAIFTTAMSRCVIRGSGKLKIDNLHWTEQTDIKEAIKSGKATRVLPNN